MTTTERNEMQIGSDMMRLVPDGASKCVVEERQHRGATVYALIAIVPNGASVPLNGYSSKKLADETAEAINASLYERDAERDLWLNDPDAC